MKKIIEKKEKLLEEITFLSKNYSSMIIVDYSKMKSTEMKFIRKLFFENNIDFKVFKNTLVKKAFIKTNNESLCDFLKGQILLIFSKKDPVLPIKMINNFSKEYEFIKIKLICLYGNIFFENNINDLINLPNKENSLFKFQILTKTPLLKFNNNLKYMLKRFLLLINSIKK